ncbi:ATP synthase, H transporting, mitochondrial Fo complex, subunit E [Chamberlinius hualienensis]
MSAALPAPVKVSPLIKFGRWSLLTAGIVYGLYHHRRLSKKEALWREHEAKEKPIRDAKKAEEKKRLGKEEMQYLSQATGMPLPDEFK